MVYGWRKNTRFGLFSNRCLLCSAPAQGRSAICHGCLADLPWNRQACKRCAAPLPAEAVTSLCGQCQRQPPLWEQAWAPLAYAWPVDRLIQRFKFNADLAAGRLLGEMLAEFLGATALPRPDWLLPVPLHKSRLAERGYNQALELARPVSHRLGIALAPGLCRRIHATQVQSRLSFKERQRNLRQAFEVTRPLSGAHVAILDDVITTGATVAALALALRDAGAASIQVWSLARAARTP